MIFRQALYSLVLQAITTSVVDASCAPDVIEFSETIGMKVEKVGSIPTSTPGPYSYNMMVYDNFDDKLYFCDQKLGKIYSYNPTSSDEPTIIFDMETSEIPDGLTLDYLAPSPTQASRIHSMAQGKKSDEVYIVFGSSTLPSGRFQVDAQLPPEGAYPGYLCPKDNATFVRDIYRPGTLPACVSIGGGFPTYTIYYVFYKYTLVNGELTNPVAFFALENNMNPGHLGGGIATVNRGGKILYSVGDCLLYGGDGRYAAQLDNSHCGKILLIDPSSPGTYNVVAKGVRNSQQMRVINYGNMFQLRHNNVLVFMDIGGVTAEEVNGIFLDRILDTSEIENFGWGRSQVDGKTREGTCYVGPGDMGVLGTEPPSEGTAPIPEKGFEQPWIQFGRSEEDFYYGITSFVAASTSFTNLSLIWTEFNTGLLLGTTGKFNNGLENKSWKENESNVSPAKGYKIKLYDNNNVYLEDGFNQLVKDEVGESFTYRGDPRLFHYPDGTAGVFIERTGVFYRLTEVNWLTDLK